MKCHRRKPQAKQLLGRAVLYMNRLLEHIGIVGLNELGDGDSDELKEKPEEKQRVDTCTKLLN